MRTTSARKSEYRPELDSVRAVAILLVLGIHAPLKVLESGYIGVTVFFCLSGYLITGLLLNELAATGRLQLRAFLPAPRRTALPGTDRGSGRDRRDRLPGHAG